MRRVVKTFVTCFLAYLLQVTAMPLMDFQSVSPNIAIVYLSIIIVGYGRQHGLVASLIIGILMEIMLANLNYFYLLLYPSIAVLSMLVFADKTERRLEMERATRKYKGNRNPLLRSISCTLYMSLLYELISIGYGLLIGMEASSNTLLRSAIFLGYNALLCSIVMLPLRKFLGLKFVFPKFGKQAAKAPRELDPSLGRQPIAPFEAEPMEENESNEEALETDKSSVSQKDPEALPDIDDLFIPQPYQRVVDLSEEEKQRFANLEMHGTPVPPPSAEQIEEAIQERTIDEESGMEVIVIPAEPEPEPEIDLSRFKRPD